MLNKNTMKITTPTDREILVSRSFNAPLQAVWDAMSKTELLRQWLFGPPGWKMTICDEDTRVGGKFHWGWSGPDGKEMSMRGEYRELTPPSGAATEARIVRTERFDFGCPEQAAEQLCTLILKEADRQTHLTLSIVYPSKEARDGALASGMEHGMASGYDRLDNIFATRSV